MQCDCPILRLQCEEIDHRQEAQAHQARQSFSKALVPRFRVALAHFVFRIPSQRIIKHRISNGIQDLKQIFILTGQTYQLTNLTSSHTSVIGTCFFSNAKLIQH